MTQKTKTKTLPSNIQSIKPEARPRKHSLGHGMHVLVMPNGHKVFQRRYRYLDKEKTFTIGSADVMSAKEAGKINFGLTCLLDQGIDPMADKKAKKAQVAAVSKHTFANVAKEWFS